MTGADQGSQSHDVLSVVERRTVLELEDDWVWDFWTVDDGQRYHLFFLCAPRSLGDPSRRHTHASIGHAISTDLVRWERLPDALAASPPPAFDDLATWTGSVIQHPDGTWLMFYTGGTTTADGVIQTIGVATSPDLTHWAKGEGSILAADPRWYETLGSGDWEDEAFRDPWVYQDPTDSSWHMLFTARSASGPSEHRGVIGHATSNDLREWTLRPPICPPGQGFAQLEVPQLAELSRGRHALVFSCFPGESSARSGPTGDVDRGVWICPVENPSGPYNLEAARPVTTSAYYSGRLVTDRDSGTIQLWCFTADERSPHFGRIVETSWAPPPEA